MRIAPVDLARLELAEARSNQQSHLVPQGAAKPIPRSMEVHRDGYMQYIYIFIFITIISC